MPSPLRPSRPAVLRRLGLTAFAWSLLTLPTPAGESAEGVRLTDWARFTPEGALEIVSRQHADTPAFAKSRLIPEDDRLLLAVMDHGAASGQKALTEKSVRPDGLDALHANGKNGAALRFAFSVSVDPKRPNRLLCRIVAARDGEKPPPERAGVTLALSKSFLGRDFHLRARHQGKDAFRATALPVDSADFWHFRSDWHIGKDSAVNRLAVPLNQGELRIEGFSGPVWFTKPNRNAGHVLLRFPETWTDNHAVNLTIELAPYRQTPLPLAAVANRSLAAALDWPADDVPAAGVSVFDNVRFAIGGGADAPERGGLALSAAPGRGSPDARLAVSAEKPFAWLYLLHAARGGSRDAPVGRLTVAYADGRTTTQDITPNDNVGDCAEPLENLSPGLSATWMRMDADGRRTAALYLARIRLEASPVKEIRFDIAKTGDGEPAEWLVAGVTGVADAGIPFHPTQAREIPCVFRPGDDWAVLPRYGYGTVPGSALDMRVVTPLHAPAGLYGPVRVNGNGDFEFRDRPGEAVRFFGGNLSSEAALPAVDQVEELAETAAALGYNAVRFHHFDEWLMKPGAEFAFDPERLDRFFRTFAEFKKRGIYATLDFYISRASGFGVDEKLHLWTVKQRVLYSPEWRDNVKEFARILLCTPNPYTGLALKDDPALAHLTAVNENPMLDTLEGGFDHPYNGKLVQQYYRDFCAERGLDPADKTTNWTLCRLDAHEREYAFFKEFLREIGCDRPLSNTNSGAAVIQNIPRAAYDFTDLHGYYDHPEFFAPQQFTNTCRNPLSEPVPPFCGTFQLRLEGQPLTVTEWHFSAPNPHRSVGGAYFGAAAAFQKAGGIYDFNTFAYNAAWFPGKRFPFHSYSLVDQFDLFSDPVSLLSNRIPAFFFARGDVKSAEREFVHITPRTPAGRAYEISADRTERRFPPEVGGLLFARRLANRIDDDLAPAPDPGRDVMSVPDILALRKNGKPDPDTLRRRMGLATDGEFVSPGGQIIINRTLGTLRVSTPASEALAQPPGDHAGRQMSVSGNTVFSTVFAGSLDGQPLSDSRRLLVMHLTDVKPSDGDFRWYGRQLRTYNRGSFGGKFVKHGDKLMRRGRVTIELAIADGREIDVHALDLTGKRLFALPFERKDGRIVWTADNYRNGQCVMAYEILVGDVPAGPEN